MAALTGQGTMAVAGGLTLPQRAQHRGMITACIICATLLQSLDQTIANVALPYMQGSFSASYDEITWVLTTYITAAAIMTAPVGWLAARFGRKRLFVICIVGFTITSMLCGAAQTLEQIVAFRLMQGVCSAALVPLSQAILFDIYPVERRGFAMAVWGMGVMIGPILGPTLGGYLTEMYNWRYVFYINLPFGVLATLGLLVFMHEGEGESHLRFDWLGFVVLSTGIGALQMMLDRGNNQDWFTSREIMIEAVLAGLAHLSVPGAHGLGAAAVDPAGAVPRREFFRRPGADVRRRHPAGLVDRADGALAADARQLSGGDRRSADGAARRRHPDRHRAGRASVDARRSASSGGARSGAAMLVVLDDDRLDAGRVGARDHHHHRAAGRRDGPGVHAVAGARLRHARTWPAHGGCCAVQPGPQHRRGDRRVGDDLAARPQRAGAARGDRRLGQSVQPRIAGAGTGEGSGWIRQANMAR